MKVEDLIQESIRTKQEFLSQSPTISQAAQLIIESLKKGGKLMICGNGGSAADAQHISAELLGRFKAERPGLAAIALTTDSSFLTAWTNDYDYLSVFERQVEALGKPEDCLLCISTSGNSENILHAALKAKSMNIPTIALSGHQGGKLKDVCQVNIIVPSMVTARIQECHLMAYHIICEMIDESFIK